MPDRFLSGICSHQLFAKFMQPKISSKRMLLVVVPWGFILLAALFLYFISKNSTQNSSTFLVENVAALSNQKQASVGLPVRLKIPKIGVDSAVIPVGLTPDGAMDVPKDPAKVAWFNLGQLPGETGNAVIAGHYNWIKNKPAIFYNLHKLNKGDKIYIEDERGAIVTFIVSEIRIYGKDEDASDVFGSSDGKARLNLITCTGTWNKAEKIYSDRLIVFTDKE
jgi:sortase A